MPITKLRVIDNIIEITDAIRRTSISAALSVGLVACESAPSADTAGPSGSVTPASLQDTPRDRAYFLNHLYVRQAMAHGNQGFADILAGRGTEARASFAESTQTMSSGLESHNVYAAERAESQSVAANILTAGLMIAGTAVAIDKTGDATSAAQVDSINQGLSSFLDASGSLGNFLQEQVRQGELNSAAVEEIDRDRWRSVVISDHRFARSIVRISNLTKNTSCTGFFIAPHVIMTAAHCFELGDGLGAYQQTPENGKSFMRGEDRFIEILHNFQDSEWNETAPVSTMRQFDIAFLLTRDPSSTFLPVSTRPIREGQRLIALGYSGDLNNGFFLQVDYGCRASSVNENGLIGSDCVIYRGNSGGPIITADGQIAVVGVNSAGYFRRDRSSEDSFAASVQRGAAIFPSVMENPAASDRVPTNPF